MTKTKMGERKETIKDKRQIKRPTCPRCGLMKVEPYKKNKILIQCRNRICRYRGYWREFFQ